MLTDREKNFIRYWDANRLKEKKLLKQLLIGLPVGFLFALPVLVILFSGKWWFKRADMVANSSLNPFVLILAIIIITGFIAVFYKKQQWDMKEQQYNELKAKEANRNETAPDMKQR